MHWHIQTIFFCYIYICLFFFSLNWKKNCKMFPVRSRTFKMGYNFLPIWLYTIVVRSSLPVLYLEKIGEFSASVLCYKMSTSLSISPKPINASLKEGCELNASQIQSGMLQELPTMNCCETTKRTILSLFSFCCLSFSSFHLTQVVKPWNSI